MVRRVVTGHTPEGKAVFASDEVLPRMVVDEAGDAFVLLWARDDVAQFPDDGRPPAASAPYPPPGGCAASIMELASGDGGPFHEFVRTTQAPWSDPDDRGMLRRPTLDYDVVLEGTPTVELDDGAEMTLGPGDVLVQNGTRHRWHNRGDTVARVLTINVGAQHQFEDGRPA